MDRSPWKVLLVDDEQQFVSTLAERLELRGIAARVAYNGDQALEAVEIDAPNIIVLDVIMPGMKGLEVLRHVKAKHPEVQVILLTGQGATRDGIEGMRLGAFDYMIKPLDIEALVEKMEEAYNVALQARNME
ncbi:response regulator [Desulfocurvibacter africanus]|uniref:Response regulator receiver protein n=1 Tax=Desulfocurvibacter africanus subsp. africanus str. Walvis Bay TaxID=690850 RepID=F3YYN5_DESAF|nr:response regulator [Desulfocurvibacter africanus]EGJ50789.1 response regulator receiver protein [Desulfocurvibacter africanus subsp. africanus str. Walvis Bay]